MASKSFTTWCSTGSSSFFSKPVTERSALLTASFTPTFSMSSYSFSCYIFALSSLNFVYRSSFSYCATQCCSITSSCALLRDIMAYYVSSYAQQRRSSVASTIQQSWVGSSPNSGSSDGGGLVDTMWLE
jgi:hypothetical protein